MRTAVVIAALLTIFVWATRAEAQSPGISPPGPTLPSTVVGSPYSQTFTTTLPSPPYTWDVAGSLPPGLTLSVTSGGAAVLSGTPSQAGSFAFELEVADSSEGFASDGYRLVVFDAIALSPSSLPNGTVGVAYSQTITASGGAGSFSLAVTGGALPAGLSLNSRTGVLSGTPTSPSTSNFTITAFDASQNSASRDYSITIFSTVSLSPPALANGTVGVAYSQTIVATGGAGSFTYAVTSGTLPAGLSLNGSTGVLSGTPTSATTSNFTITATDIAGSAASRAYSIAVSTPTGTVQVVSGDKQVVPASTGAPVDLVARIVDGQGSPVAGAEVSWAVVQGGGTLSNSALVSDAQGMVRSGYTTGPEAVDNLVRVTATGSGSSFTFTVRNQRSAVIEPARQLIGPQALLAIAAPTVQLNNIRQRLDQLRLQRNPAVMQRLRVSVDGRALPPASAFALARLDKDGKPQKGGGASADKADAFEPLGVFVNGDVNIGRQSAVDTQTGFKLRSKGITVGADYRLRSNHVLGAAVGFMKSDTTLDGGAGDQDADGYSLSLFGSLVPVDNAYVDGIVTFGRNSYDSERRAAGALLASSTDGNQWALAVNAGYALNRGPLTMTPFARVEYVDARIDAFSESGDAAQALAIGEQRLKATTLALGGQVSYAVSTSWGVLLPNGRLEFQHLARSSTDDVSARIASDTVSVPALIQGLGTDRNFGYLALGVSAVFARGISGFVNYEQEFGRDSRSDRRYLLGVRAEF